MLTLSLVAADTQAVRGGMDLFFVSRQDAAEFVSFLSTLAPVRSKESTKVSECVERVGSDAGSPVLRMDVWRAQTQGDGEGGMGFLGRAYPWRRDRKVRVGFPVLGGVLLSVWEGVLPRDGIVGLTEQASIDRSAPRERCGRKVCWFVEGMSEYCGPLHWLGRL